MGGRSPLFRTDYKLYRRSPYLYRGDFFTSKVFSQDLPEPGIVRITMDTISSGITARIYYDTGLTDYEDVAISSVSGEGVSSKERSRIERIDFSGSGSGKITIGIEDVLGGSQSELKFDTIIEQGKCAFEFISRSIQNPATGELIRSTAQMLKIGSVIVNPTDRIRITDPVLGIKDRDFIVASVQTQRSIDNQVYWNIILIDDQDRKPAEAIRTL